MFKTLHRCPRTVARHENGPLHESRLRYLEHLAAQGAALHTITAAAGIIYRAAIWMKLDESGPVERKDVERAAERWAHRSYRNASSHGPEQTESDCPYAGLTPASSRCSDYFFRPSRRMPFFEAAQYSQPCGEEAPAGHARRNRQTLPVPR